MCLKIGWINGSSRSLFSPSRGVKAKQSAGWPICAVRKGDRFFGILVGSLQIRENL